GEISVPTNMNQGRDLSSPLRSGRDDNWRADRDGWLVGAGEDAAPSLPRRLQRAQAGLDLGPVRLQERRQHQALAQRGWILIHGEAGAVSSDLVEDVTGLAEVDRAEVVAV